MNALRLLPVIAAAAAFYAPMAQALEFEGAATIVSDYRWRGASLSDENPSLQLEGTLSHDSGAWLYGGLNTVSSAYGGAEIEAGLGYTHDLAGLEWTTGVEHYFYPGEADIDYTELDVSGAAKLGRVTFSAGVEYTPEQTNYDDDDTYAWVSAEYDAHAIRFHSRVGRDDGVMAPKPYALDFVLGAAVPVNAFVFDLSYDDGETHDQAWVVSFAYRR